MRLLRGILVLSALAAIAVAGLGAPRAALWRNLLLVASAGAVLVASARARGRARDLPIPRKRGVVPAVIAAAAVASTARTLALPYFADDWQLLDLRGRGSLLESVAILPGEPWFRPVGWIAWWFYHHLSPLEGTLGHAVSVALFAATAALAVPALRRLGIPRGIASAAALLFALSPVALDTVAWITNQYALLGTFFSVAAIAALPFGRATPRRMLLPCALAALAFLSREDTYLLPALAACVLARFDPRRAIVGIRRAAPLLVLVAAVAGARHFALGDAGVYQDPRTGESAFLRRIVYGPRLALMTELPASYLLPCRELPSDPWARALWWAIPAIVVAAGGASVAARRGLVRAIAIVAVGLAPTAPLLPIGPELETVRWLYFPSLGFSLAVASLLGGAAAFANATASRRAAAFRWGSILAYGALGVAAGCASYGAWRDSAAALREGIRLAKPAVAAAPRDAAIWLPGVPWVVRGAYCANCGIPFLYRRTAAREDVRVLDAVSAIKVVDVALEVDTAQGTIRGFLDPTNAVDLSREAPWRLDLTAEPLEAKGARAIDLRVTRRADGALFASGLPGCLLLPVMRAAPGAKLRVHVSGELPPVPGDSFDSWVRRTMASPAGLARRPIVAGEAFELPDGVDSFRIDVTLPNNAWMLLREIWVEVSD